MTSPARLRARRRWRERSGIAYRCAAAAVGLSAVVVQALTSAKVWTDAPKELLPTLLIATGATVFRDNIVNVQRRLREPERHKLRVHAQKAAAVALYSVAQQRSLPMPDLGISVFLIERTGWLRRDEQLDRLIRLRLKDAPQPSDVEWTRGKGVIGKAWKEGRPIHERTSGYAKRWGGKELTPARWERMKSSAKQGFTLEEFTTTVHKYAEILAVPIKNEAGEVLGVVSLDLAMAADVDLNRDWLAGPAVEETVSVAADLIAKLRKSP